MRVSVQHTYRIAREWKQVEPERQGPALPSRHLPIPPARQPSSLPVRAPLPPRNHHPYPTQHPPQYPQSPGYPDQRALPSGGGEGKAPLPPRPKVEGENEPEEEAIHEVNSWSTRKGKLPISSLWARGPASAFLRMARVQSFSAAADAFFALGLVGTIFFASDPTEARWRVALYLALTVAPFAIAAPLVAPLLDRLHGGRKWTLFGAAAARAILAFLIMRDMDSLWFYPEVFLLLVLGKVHMISKSAIIPTTVAHEDKLVNANSQLSVFAVIAGVAAAAIGLGISQIGADWSVGAASICFGLAAWQAWHLPNVVVAPTKPDPEEIAEIRSKSIGLGVNAIMATRALIGFFIFFAAFNFKSTDQPLWWLGVVAVAAQGGYFLGVISAPPLQRRFSESQVITICLAAMLGVGILSTTLLGVDILGPRSVLLATAVCAFVLGGGASAAKLAFDALVQRDAPDANRGWLFSRLESRFQLVWALGALASVAIPFPPLMALLIVTVTSSVVFTGYLMGRHKLKMSQAARVRR